MADTNLEQLKNLFDEKLSPINQRLDKFEKHVTEQFTGVKKEFQGINTRLDLVARQLAKVGATQVNHSQQLTNQDAALDRIQRQLVKKDDRLDSHGQRIEKLEAKTAHLPEQRR